MNGVLIIDKLAGLTSHDVVARARRILGQRSVGHLGTLDPMATGVLPLVTGCFTRLAQFYTGAEKVYEGTIRFGFSTDTYDAEGEASSEPKAVTLSASDVENAAARFRGVIQQLPPPFSAKKIKGVPAYKLARKQKPVVLAPIEVEVKEFDLLAVESDRVRFRARVTSGTYMRSIAHDMGAALGCGAHLECLRRTAVAEFTLEDAHSLQEIAEAGNTAAFGRTSSGGSEGPPIGVSAMIGGGPVIEASQTDAIVATCADDPAFLFVHPRRLLPQMPAVTADEASVARIRAGRSVNLPELSRAPLVKVFAGQRDLVSIASRIAGTLFHPKIVFVADPA